LVLNPRHHAPIGRSSPTLSRPFVILSQTPQMPYTVAREGRTYDLSSGIAEGKGGEGMGGETGEREEREGREGREREGRTSAHPSRLAAHSSVLGVVERSCDLRRLGGAPPCLLLSPPSDTSCQAPDRTPAKAISVQSDVWAQRALLGHLCFAAGPCGRSCGRPRRPKRALFT